MKASAFGPCLWTTLLLFAASALYAFEAGGRAFTKRVETNLLAEPNPMAAIAGKLPFGKEVSVDEVKGAWLQVSAGATSGWVFGGNLTATKPAEGKGLDGLPLTATQTTAAAAARPLAPAALQYASQKNLAQAREDLEWLLAESHAISPDQVTAFMQEKQKGEFQ